MTSVKEILTQEEIQALLLPELDQSELAHSNFTGVEFHIERITTAKELETLCSSCEMDTTLFNRVKFSLKNSSAVSFLVSLVLIVRPKEIRLKIINISLT